MSGSSICLRVHEFVPHPGYFEIYLSDIAVGRDTSDDEANWIILDDFIQDPTEDSITTGIQAFNIDLPNITCNHCTLRVKQWASDLDWYYTTCTDIKIIDNDDDNMMNNNNNDTCVGINSEWGETCEWSEAGSLLRIMILQSIILGTTGLVAFLILVLMISYTSECFGFCNNKCGSYIRNKKNNSSLYQTGRNNGDIEMDDKTSVNDTTATANHDSINDGCWFKIKRNVKTFWLLYTFTWIFIIVAFVVVAVIIVEMKNCNISSDYGEDV